MKIGFSSLEAETKMVMALIQNDAGANLEKLSDFQKVQLMQEAMKKLSSFGDQPCPESLIETVRDLDTTSSNVLILAIAKSML